VKNLDAFALGKNMILPAIIILHWNCLKSRHCGLDSQARNDKAAKEAYETASMQVICLFYNKN